MERHGDDGPGGGASTTAPTAYPVGCPRPPRPRTTTAPAPEPAGAGRPQTPLPPWARMSPVVKITYPPELPVSARRDEIGAAIRDHQVVIVAGETGSGKTTAAAEDLPGAGPRRAGLIGHTQPRRIAARASPSGSPQELEVRARATSVGYKIRFTDRSVAATAYVKLMTDGILLAEIQGDPLLSRLRHHHHRRGARAQPQHRLPARLPRAAPAAAPRSEGDRHLGHARRASASRAFFGGAPVVEVSGRTYPVEVRGAPPGDDGSEVYSAPVGRRRARR